MSPELATAVASLVSLAVGWLIRHLTAGPSTPAVPAKPDPKSPAPPDSGSDPLSKLPGLPGHPFLNLIIKVLPRWLGTPVVQDTPSAIDDATHDHAALVALAGAIKADPARLTTMKSLLG